MNARLRDYLITLAIIVGPFAATVRGDWFLNTRGPVPQATITRFTDDGMPAPFEPSIVEPGGHWLAWPSAVSLAGGGVRVYASAFDGARWYAIVAWEQAAPGAAWNRIGPVLQADASEPYGIGTAHVVFNPMLGYWQAWYVRLNAAGVGDQVRYAWSYDGLAWIRLGWPVYQPSTYHDAGGFGLDYACQATSGAWYLWLSAYPAGLTGSSAVRVSAPVPWGPFGWFEPLLGESWWAYPRYIVSGQARTGVLVVDETDGLEAGGAALVTNGQQVQTQVVTIGAVDAASSRIMLRTPLAADAAGWSITPIERRYISPSYAREHPDGSWSGIFTGYNPVAGLTAEYTFAAKTDANGWWTIDRARPAPIFSPLLFAGLYSTENPARVSTSASCAE